VDSGDGYGFVVHAGSKFASFDTGPLYGIAAGLSPQQASGVANVV
jgi:hypothetical protein